jgi:hypothetical protein
MFRYDSVADAPPGYKPVRKYLAVVLMMAVRDRADQIRFSHGPDQLSVWYRVEEKWYELVPPPPHVWPRLLDEIRRTSRLVAPERTANWREQIRRWFAPDGELMVGWLTFRVGDRDVLYRVRRDSYPSQGELFLELASPLTDLETIEIETSYEIIEFDFS